MDVIEICNKAKASFKKKEEDPNRQANLALAKLVYENNPKAHKFFFKEIFFPVVRGCICSNSLLRDWLKKTHEEDDFVTEKLYDYLSRIIENDNPRWDNIRKYQALHNCTLKTWVAGAADVNVLSWCRILKKEYKDNGVGDNFESQLIEDEMQLVEILGYGFDLSKLRTNILSKLSESEQLLYELTEDMPKGSHDKQKRVKIFDKLYSHKPELMNKTNDDKCLAINRDINRLWKKVGVIGNELLKKEPYEYEIKY